MVTSESARRRERGEEGKKGEGVGGRDRETERQAMSCIKGRKGER